MLVKKNGIKKEGKTKRLEKKRKKAEEDSGTPLIGHTANYIFWVAEGSICKWIMGPAKGLAPTIIQLSLVVPFSQEACPSDNYFLHCSRWVDFIRISSRDFP